MDPTEHPTSRPPAEGDASPTADGDGSAELPRADELADDHDQDGWDRDRHGTFADHAEPDDAVTTVPADDYLAGAR